MFYFLTFQVVKKLGEKIMVELYKKDPKSVLSVMPKDTVTSRKANRNLKNLFEIFEELDNS